MGKQWKQWETLFSCAPKSLQVVTAAMKLKDTCSLEAKLCKPRQHIKSRDITLPTKVHIVRAMVFPVVMYGCESWTIKKAEHRIIDAFALWYWRRLLRVSWTERKSVLNIHCKDRCWSWSSNTWPPDVKNWVLRKGPDARKDWRQEEKGVTEDGLVGWHHRLNGHELEQAPGVGDGRVSLTCFSPWSHKELGTTKWLNWLNWSAHTLILSNDNSCNKEMFYTN